MDKTRRTQPQDRNYLVACKGDERYIFIWSDDNRQRLLRTLGRFASNSELSFTWYDAAMASKHVREWHNKKRGKQ
jgi:hypothetical protein